MNDLLLKNQHLYQENIKLKYQKAELKLAIKKLKNIEAEKEFLLRQNQFLVLEKKWALSTIKHITEILKARTYKGDSITDLICRGEFMLNHLQYVDRQGRISYEKQNQKLVKKF